MSMSELINPFCTSSEVIQKINSISYVEMMTIIYLSALIRHGQQRKCLSITVDCFLVLWTDFEVLPSLRVQ